MIVEIAFDIQSDEQLQLLEDELVKLGIAYYIEPPNRFISLEDCECDCEGK